MQLILTMFSILVFVFFIAVIVAIDYAKNYLKTLDKIDQVGYNSHTNLIKRLKK